jgi:aldose 1-epimerase
MTPILLLLALTTPNFSAEKTTDHGLEVIRLSDAAHHVQASIAPSLGNRAYELSVNGKNLLWVPKDRAAFSGIPFLAPWGNRIPGGGFWANGKRYNFNFGLNNLSVNKGIAIHGMLQTSPLWEVIEMGADRKSAHFTARLQFWRYPDLMANWPFAHEYLMTYSLSSDGLSVSTTIKNLGAEPMPVVIGFHPYFNMPDVPRAECAVHIPAKKHVEMDSNLVATGAFTDVAFPDQVSLKDHTFDDGFTGLIRDANGTATFALQSGAKKIEVVYGPNYKVALVFAPPGQSFVCFEPMAGITNAVNLAHEGKYPELQTVAPNATWHETFTIRLTGF